MAEPVIVSKRGDVAARLVNNPPAAGRSGSQKFFLYAQFLLLERLDSGLIGSGADQLRMNLPLKACVLGLEGTDVRSFHLTISSLLVRLALYFPAPRLRRGLSGAIVIEAYRTYLAKRVFPPVRRKNLYVRPDMRSGGTFVGIVA